MANTFYPFPTVGGSNNIWGTALNFVLQGAGMASLTAELYNDAGALKLSKGEIGIDDGTVKGISIIDTITTISTLGMTASNWHAVEMSVSGTAVTISIAAIAGATDESTIDAATKAAYDYAKQGYYLVGTKRLLGVVYLRAALALGRVVNCESGNRGFKNIKIITYADEAGVESNVYIAEHKQEMGDWNMDANAFKYVECYTPTFHNLVWKRLTVKSIMIRNDADTYHYILMGTGGGTSLPFTIAWSVLQLGASALRLDRVAAGEFDHADFDSVGYNRGWVFFEYET